MKGRISVSVLGMLSEAWNRFSSTTPKLLVTALALWFCGCFSGTAANTRDMAYEAEVEKELGQTHPELVTTFQDARIAFDSQDYAQSERLLRQVLAKVPDFAVALRRLGASLVEQGKRAEGLTWCEKAVAQNRSAENLLSLAYNLLHEEGNQANQADAARALQLLIECRSLPRGMQIGTLGLTAQAALTTGSQAEFETARELMAQNFPKEMLTHYYGAVQAAMREQWMLADKEIKRAEKLGLSHEATQRFRNRVVGSHAFWAYLVFDTLMVVALWVGGLVLLFGLGFFLSKLTLRQVRQADSQETVTSGERSIRRLYRVILNIAGVYYYISLPIVLVLVVGIVAALLYLCLMVGRIPIKLMVILGLGAIFTVVAMVKSLFIRVNASDPGRLLQREEAPALWQLTEEVAQSVGTRPVDEIRLTPGTDLAVYERGTWRQKLRNEAQRILILGTGVLNGFKQNDFRCVLAHEYGHFSHRDTAGGDIALRVRNDMLKFYFAMRAAGQATYLNAAFHFLRIYDFIFRRISHGATRLQEILADRVAAQIYGAPAFQGGLTHVVRRSLEFEAAANLEIKQSIESRRPLQNLYDLPAPVGSTVTTELAKALNRPTTADDTHPSPRDRFHLVARLQQPSAPPREGEVWELFRNPEAIRQEMVALIERQIAPHRQQAGAAVAGA